MKTKTFLVASCLLASTMAISAADAPAPAHVIEVITIDTGGNMQKFMELSKRAAEIAKQVHAGGTVRYYMTTWAGDGAGRVVVTIEHQSLAALAQSEATLNASPEFRKWQADVAASGIKELSSSLVTELRF
jgi:ribosomal protein S5